MPRTSWKEKLPAFSLEDASRRSVWNEAASTSKGEPGAESTGVGAGWKPHHGRQIGELDRARGTPGHGRQRLICCTIPR